MVSKDIIRLSIENIIKDEFNYSLILNSSFYFKHQQIIDEILTEYKERLSLYHDNNVENNRCYIVKDTKYIISYLPIQKEVSENDMRGMWLNSCLPIL